MKGVLEVDDIQTNPCEKESRNLIGYHLSNETTTQRFSFLKKLEVPFAQAWIHGITEYNLIALIM